MAMGQNPVPPVNIPIPSNIGSKMGGEFTYPKMVPLVLTHSHIKIIPVWPRSGMALLQVQTKQVCEGLEIACACMGTGPDEGVFQKGTP